MKYLVLLTFILSSNACKRSGISGAPGFKAEPAMAGKSSGNTKRARTILGTSWEACIQYDEESQAKCPKNSVCPKQTYFQATINISKLYILEVNTKNRFSDEYCTLKHPGYDKMQESSQVLAVNDLKAKSDSHIQFTALGSTDAGEIQSTVDLKEISSRSLQFSSKLDGISGSHKMYKVQN